jgi:Domain of unknown function (DUF4833)
MHTKKISLFIISLISLALQGVAQVEKFPVPVPDSKQLFYLQRTSNTNTIVYELNLQNGTIDKENPVKEYWIRYQEKGQREDLNYIQRKFAYGIKSKKIAENQYELSFVSYKKYKMILKLAPDNKFYVYTNINQKAVILNRIFIKINGGSFWSPNVEYVEISGTDPNTRSVVKERLKI